MSPKAIRSLAIQALGVLVLLAITAGFILSARRSYFRIRSSTPPETPVAVTPPPVTPAAPQHPCSGRTVLPILMYHHIAAHVPQDPYYVSPANFAKQMDWLSTHHYDPTHLSQAIACLKGKGKVPDHAVVITLDDGDVDQVQNAFPVLRRHHFPAIFYITLKNYNQPDGVSTADLKALLAAGMDIGAHSVTHSDLARLRPEAVQFEVTESKRRLEHDLGITITSFAYPGGAFNALVVSAVQKAGYTSAVTTHHSITQDPNDLFRLNRSHIDDDLQNLIARVQGTMP